MGFVGSSSSVRGHGATIDAKATSGGDQVRFGLEVEDETPTLLEFDIVDLDAPITDELRAMIQRDGRLIYEEI